MTWFGISPTVLEKRVDKHDFQCCSMVLAPFWTSSGLVKGETESKVYASNLICVKTITSKLVLALLLRAPRDTPGRPEGSRSDRKQPRNSRSADSWGGPATPKAGPPDT